MPILVSDSFQAADGTVIDGRTPDETPGGKWKEVSFFLGVIGTVQIISGKTDISNADAGFIYNGKLPDNYDIYFSYFVPNSTDTFRGGCRFRIQDPSFIPGGDWGALDYYFMTFRYPNNDIRMVKLVDGAETQVFLIPYTWTVGASHQIRILVDGSQYTVFVNGVQQISVSDSTYTTGHTVGFGKGSATNLIIDDIKIYSIKSSTSMVLGA